MAQEYLYAKSSSFVYSAYFCNCIRLFNSTAVCGQSPLGELRFWASNRCLAARIKQLCFCSAGPLLFFN